METKTSLHPIHPTLQFEAKHALRFLDNLLKTRTTAVSGGRDRSAVWPVFKRLPFGGNRRNRSGGR